MYDLANEVKTEVMFPYAVLTDTANSAVVDMLGFESLIILLYGAQFLGGTATLTIKHGDTNVIANMVAVPETELIGTNNKALVPADTLSLFKFGYIGSKRYLAMTLTEDTAWTVWVPLGIAIKSNPNKLPIA